jgi:hypothetical protein
MRVAWMLATGASPKGTVRARNGDDRDLRPENLILTPRGPKPFGDGGRVSSLRKRAIANAKLLQAMVSHPDAPIAQLSALIGSSQPCTCTRLQRLSEQGLCHGPQCVPGRAWALSQAGRDLAASAIPPLDNLDRDILTACARVPTKLMALAHRIGVCRLTVRRRIDRLVEQKLMFPHEGRYAITDAGIAALGPDAPPRQPWVNLERVRASTARDVVARHGQEPDDRTRAFRSKIASLGAQQALATSRLKRHPAFSHWANAMTG